MTTRAKSSFRFPTDAAQDRARRNALRSAQQQNGRRARERNERYAEMVRERIASAEAARPVWQLEWHPEVVIRPPRPAPVKRYADTGRPTEFQDDLNAIADHGSPPPISIPMRRSGASSLVTA